MNRYTQSHYIPRKLDPHAGLTAIFAVEPNKRAIIFVHGYGGDAISTWSEFDRFCLTLREFSSYDLLFFGYDGLRSELLASSLLFHKFLAWLFADSVVAINDSLPSGVARDRSFGYESVTLVCHSLGAVIARWALLEATNGGDPWASKVRLVLFAPAHTGANVVRLALEVSSHWRFLEFFTALARFESPLIDQLKEGSTELTMLWTDTERALQAGANQHLKAAKVCIAERERIVKNLPFCLDPRSVPLAGTTHRTICKPHSSFPQPLVALAEGLK
jgi:pimeloyl-ACP methyl ester carboxylesterase